MLWFLSFRRAVFKGKALLKPPNYSYYLFLSLSPKLVKAFEVVIELGCLDACGGVVTLLSGVRGWGEMAESSHTSREGFPGRSILTVLSRRREDRGFKNSGLSCLAASPNKHSSSFLLPNSTSHPPFPFFCSALPLAPLSLCFF